MFCSKCGFELIDGTSFCRKCGSKNIYSNLIPDEKKSTLDLNTISKKTNTKQTDNDNKQAKPKGFIILGVLILLLSVGFGSYYISVSKFFSENSKSSEKTPTKNKVIPKDNVNKNSDVKSAVPDSTTKTDISNINSPDYYIFPKSGSEKLLDADVSKVIKENLTLARNEIYARHGLVFKGEQFNSYFSKKSWYKPNPDFKGSDGELTDVENYNIQLLLKYEK